MHSACGIISPNRSTTVTDRITDVTGSVIRSSTSGSDSAAIAFHTTSVTSSLCGLLIMLRIFSACFFSCDLPLLIRISISTSSNDIRPSVSPDISPAVSTRPMLDSRNTRYSASVSSSGFSREVGRIAYTVPTPIPNSPSTNPSVGMALTTIVMSAGAANIERRREGETSSGSLLLKKACRTDRPVFTTRGR